MSNVMFQAARFGAVGLAATVTHVLAVVAMVELAAVPVLTANFGAFLIAVLVTYLGNHRWTFECEGAHARYFPRFVAIAALSLALGQMIVWVITQRAGGDYRIAVAVVALIMPAFGFAASRFFVFAPRNDFAESAHG